MQIEMEIIATMKNKFTEKFGIPRQSGMIEETEGRIVFEGRYRNPDYVRGLEGFSHIWLLWIFSENRNISAAATVRPPRLGGNTRIGVFATRSPYRPNPVGLSCVRLEKIEMTESGPELIVRGADIMNGTPIIDIKPYLSYADRIEDATGRLADEYHRIPVIIPEEMEAKLHEGERDEVKKILSLDPRPAYQQDNRIYGMCYGNKNIRFRAENGMLGVVDIEERRKG